MNHQANLLDRLALPVNPGLGGLVGAVVACGEGVVKLDGLTAVTRLHYGESPVVVSSLIVGVLDSRRRNNNRYY